MRALPASLLMSEKYNRNDANITIMKKKGILDDKQTAPPYNHG